MGARREQIRTRANWRVSDEAYSAQELLDKLEGSGAKVKMVVFDACRDNPLRVSRSLARGLARMEGEGTLVVFATGAGNTAGDSGVFSREFVRGLRIPGIAADEAMKRVARAVNKATEGRQTPVIYGLLLEDFAFVPESGRVTVAAVPAVEPKPVALERPQNGMSGPSQPSRKTNPKDGLTYVWIQPGTFTMGCSVGDKECWDSERPAHRVTISKGFWIGDSPVTQAAYKRVTGGDPSNFKGQDLPVEKVNWMEARDYCQNVGLPTDAEWEYAARAGTTSARYGELKRIAWYEKNSDGNTHEVKQKKPNAWGLYDMLGNVRQWTGDWSGGAYTPGSQQDPEGAQEGQLLSLRMSDGESILILRVDTVVQYAIAVSKDVSAGGN